MRQWLMWGAGLLLMLVPAAVGITQETTPEPTPAPRLEITGVNASELPTITVTTSVLTRNNRPAANLTAADFTLSGDLAQIARIERVESITDDDLPFATVLGIDVSDSMAGTPLDDAKAAARQFVESVGAEDPVAIVAFARDARLVQDFTTDTDALLTAIDSLQLNGATALYDGALTSISTAAESPVPRRAVILLSDGNEYGDAFNQQSQSERGDALNTVRSAGVSVYTIGLGFDIDESYLTALANQSNARFVNAPTSDELSSIYDDLAQLFRSQYVVTLQATDDIPLDGTEYPFTLQAQTADGATNEASSVVRAPIPTPLVDLNLPDAPINEPTTIEPTIRADDELAEIRIMLDGDTLAPDTRSITLDPADYAPSTLSLTVTATDVDGDMGSADGTITIAAIPPSSATLVTEFAEGETITNNQNISVVDIISQTPPVDVRYRLFNRETDEMLFDDTRDTEFTDDFAAKFSPFEYVAGAYTLQADVFNAAEEPLTLTRDFAIDEIAPRVSIRGIDDGQTLNLPETVIAEGSAQADATIAETTLAIANSDIAIPEDAVLRPENFPPGDYTLRATVTDERGLSSTRETTFTVPALPPELTLPESISIDSATTAIDVMTESQTPITQVRYAIGDQSGTLTEAQDDVFTVPIDAAALGDGTYTLSIEALNAGGERASATVEVTITLPTPTPTVTPSNTPTPTPDATGTAQAAQATGDAIATTDALGTATRSAEQTAAAQATGTRQAEIAEATQEAQSTQTAIAEATQEAQSTQTAIVEATENAQSTQTAIAEATQEAQATQIAIAEATQEAQSTQTAVAEATQEAQVTQTTIAEATQDAQSTQTAIAETTQEAQATSTAERVAAVSVASTAASEATSTADAASTDTPEPTATPQPSDTPQSTDTAEPTATDTPEPTNTAEPTATDTPEPTNTAEPTATDTPEPTNTAEPTATDTPEPTNTTEPTATDTPEATDTPQPLTETPTPETTPDIEATEGDAATPLPTLTPPTIQEEGGDQPLIEGNQTGIMFLGAALALFIVLLLMIVRGRRQSNE